MRDIVVRLAYSHPLCTCLTKTPELTYHDELCIYRVVRDAETEILNLRSARPKGDRPDSGGNTIPL